jgi:hypothetical protein
MAVNADAFTISAIILLIVGAICFYLFTRIKQTEKKLALMEGILLDLKTATEAAFLDFPAHRGHQEEEEEEDEETQNHGELNFLPELPEEGTANLDAEELEAVGGAAEEVRRVEVAMTKEEDNESISGSTVQVNKIEQSSDLESLSVPELAAIARNKGITGTGKMRKGQLITAIKDADATKPLPEQPLDVDGVAAGSSLLDSSSLMASPL